MDRIDPSEPIICKYTVGKHKGIPLYPRNLSDSNIGEHPVPSTTDLMQGRMYCQPTLLGKYHMGRAWIDKIGTWWLRAEFEGTKLDLYAILQRGGDPGDHRGVWVVHAWMNKAGVVKMRKELGLTELSGLGVPAL